LHSTYADVKYFTLNIKARDRKAIPAVTIPQVQHHQGWELSKLRRHHCQLVVASIEVPQLVLLENLIKISIIHYMAIQFKVFNPQLSHANDSYYT